jgi:phage virion morphogenesis protein
MSAEPIISIQYEGEAVRELLEQLAARIENLYEPMVNIGEYLLLSTDTNFAEQRSPDGTPWQPLSAYTLRLKAENHRLLEILQSTGRLRASIAYQADADSVVVGTNIDYGVKHQLGLDGLAARPFLGVSEADEAVILEILEDYLLALT